jgi:NDP-sugar pyrophosphorylase family protein
MQMQTRQMQTGRPIAGALSRVPAIILCGGKGSRLQPLTGDHIPKALVRIGELTLLDHTLQLLRRNGMRRAILATSHHSDQIWQHVKEVDNGTLEITISQTEQPLGVIPSVITAFSEFALDSTFLLAGADEICEGLDLEAVYRFHQATSSLATIVLTSHIVSEYSSLKAAIDVHGHITSIARGTPISEYTATGIAFLEPGFLTRALQIEQAEAAAGPESLLNVLLPQLIAEKRLHGMVCSMKRYMHISTPEAYQAACFTLSTQYTANMPRVSTVID